MWDPGQYQRFAHERSRPFFDLLARVPAEDPKLVVDMGCGPGNLTVTLAERWPGAEVCGVDSSAEMIEAARQLLSTRGSLGAGAAKSTAGDGGPDDARPHDGAPDNAGPHDGAPDDARPHDGWSDDARIDDADAARLSFTLADVAQWQPDREADVIVSNAVLQWIPDHLAVLSRWTGFLAAPGWLAIQVPGNNDEPSHLVLRELADSNRWRAQLSGTELNRQAADPADYLDLLARADLQVDAWETTYLHVLHGENPVLDWYRGTGLRPVLATLPPADQEEFLAEYASRMRSAYPATPYGTVFPFRRVFAVAHRPAS
jgi:trans-aconitate 2-methyltransferase